MIYILFGSEEVCIFPLFYIVLGNDIIMTSVLVKWFQNLHILWNFEQTISLQRFNAVGRLWHVL